MNYYVYEIENLINGKKYIGKRSCHCDIDKDDYMGSGKNIKEAVKKYGLNNFKKRILKICKDDLEAYEVENLLFYVLDIENNDNYYNIRGVRGRKRPSNTTGIKIINKDNGMEFSSIKEASTYYKVAPITIKRILTKETKYPFADLEYA